eukprot:PITA_19824
MSPTRSGYKELGLELVEPLQDQPRKSRRPPMANEKKDEGAGDPIKILLEESFERQMNIMMDKFAQILQRLPRGDASASSSSSRNATPFKVQVNLEIPIFKGQIDVDVIDKWLNLLEGYFSIHEFLSQEKIIFTLLEATPYVKDWWETYCKQNDESTGSLLSTTPTWDSFRDAINKQYYPVKSYEDKYIKWTMLRQGRDQDVPEFTNSFHTLRTQLGIKDYDLHLVLKYYGCLHRYIQEEMEFLNISSLGTSYRYDVKIEQKFKQKKQDFGSVNPKTKGQSQIGVTQENPSKPQEKNKSTKLKKDTGKWCEFHKSPSHNAKPSVIVATAKIQKNELEDPEEGERLFHSQMWVKGSLLQFIVDSGSQKNLILAEVMRQLGLPTTQHLQPYNIGWLHEGRDLKVRQQCHLPYNIKPFIDEVLHDITPLDVCDVLLGQPYLWR